MNLPDWAKKLPSALTVTDKDLRIIYMNERSGETFASEGGLSLVGKNLLDCHKKVTHERIRGLIATGGTNMYTIEKKGQKKLIYQSAWLEDDGSIGGLVELSIVLPADMPHYVRT